MARGRTATKISEKVKDESAKLSLQVSGHATIPASGTLEMHVDRASNKNLGTRTEALRQLHLAFAPHYLPEFAEKFTVTILDLIEKYINKTAEESILCSLLLAHLAIQSGTEMSSDLPNVYASLRSIIASSKSEMVRSMAALSLAVSTYLSCEDNAMIQENIEALHETWTSIETSSNSSQLFKMSISGWALLLQNDHKSLKQALEDYYEITEYLEADLPEIRVSCGGVIACIYELAKSSVNPNFQFPNHDEVVDSVEDLITDSVKQTPKVNRGSQRDSNRYLRDCIVDGDKPSVIIKFGNEELELDSCINKLFFDLCSEVLHGGIDRHLGENQQLRDFFDLGPVSTEEEELAEMDKLTRMAYLEANAKVREQTRGQQRDKRAVVF